MGSAVYEFAGQPDFELNSDRSHPVSMIVETPDTAMADGLVFIIPGMGGEKDKHYSEMIRRYIASKYNLVVVSVDAHCNTCRPQRSTEFGSVGVDVNTDSIAAALGLHVAQGGAVDTPLNNYTDILSLFRRNANSTYRLKATFEPPGGQYQNFGVLSALDYIAALHTLIDLGLPFNQNNVVCIGSSHGGYISHMMNKLAPNTINGIIDASAYTEPVTQFLDGQWTELDISDGNLVYSCSTLQKWQFSKIGVPSFFSPDRALVRDTAHAEHLEVVAQASDRSCQFRMVYPEVDRIAPTHLKSRQAQLLKSLGYDVSYEKIGEADIDGKLIKSADHGMGIALNLLFDKYYPTLTQKSGSNDRELETNMTFEGPKMSYSFQYRRGQIHPEASCTEIGERTSELDAAELIAS